MFLILPCSSAVPSASSTLFRPLDTLMEYDGRFAILNSLITICVHTTISGPVLSLGRGGGDIVFDIDKLSNQVPFFFTHTHMQLLFLLVLLKF